MLFKLGYRNLWRNSRRTLLTMSAMALATAMLVLFFGVYTSMMRDMLLNATDLYHGHARISADGYVDTRSIELTLDEANAVSQARQAPEVLGAAGRVRAFLLLSSGEGDQAQTHPAELLGIAPEEEATVTRLHERVARGRYLDPVQEDDLVLGIGLARRLGADVGGEIIMMGQRLDGSVAAALYHVAGIIDTGDPIRDSSLALVNRTTLQQDIDAQGQLHEVVIALQRPLDAPLWVSGGPLQLSGAELHSWQDFLPVMAQYLDLIGAAEWVMTLIFYFAVFLVSTNTMQMSFFERTREFGVMNAIGMRPGRLSRLILLEGSMLGVLSAVVGGMLGTGLTLLLYHYPLDFSSTMSGINMGGTVWAPRFGAYLEFGNVLRPMLMMVALGIVIAIIPALRLRRLQPVEALRKV